MDRAQFDALARLVSTKGSRRTALATVFGVALLRQDPEAGRAKGKVRAQAKAKAKTKSKPCYPGKSCTPGKGKNTSGCDFSNSSVFRDKDVRGANLSNSNFINADATGADFRGANVSGACLVHANLTGAKLGNSVNLGNATFCRTLMPDGSFNDRDCDKGTACCPTPPVCEGDDCDENIICTPYAGMCSALSPIICCDGSHCAIGGGYALSRCLGLCNSDQECQTRLPNDDVACWEHFVLFQGSGCYGKSCNVNSDCRNGVCCEADPWGKLRGTNICCLHGQVCSDVFGCVYPI